MQHAGFDCRATNASDGSYWDEALSNDEFIVDKLEWPLPVENICCSALWRQAVAGERTFARRMTAEIKRVINLMVKACTFGS